MRDYLHPLATMQTDALEIGRLLYQVTDLLFCLTFIIIPLVRSNPTFHTSQTF